MAVQIEALDGGKLKVTGDMEGLLRLPARAVEDGFFFAFSDGTLIRGYHDIATGKCQLTLAAEGAALVRILRDDRHDRALVEWKIEWMTLSCGNETLCPISAKSSGDECQLQLDIGAREAA